MKSHSRKTGHTEAAKNTLVTAASRDGMTLVCVVLRSDGESRFMILSAFLITDLIIFIFPRYTGWIQKILPAM